MTELKQLKNDIEFLKIRADLHENLLKINNGYVEKVTFICATILAVQLFIGLWGLFTC